MALMDSAAAFRRTLSGEGGVFVLDVKCTQMTRVLVDILRHLTGEKDGSGVVFSVDRPSAFLSRLLERQGVPQDRLLYLDAVTGISGEEPGRVDRLELFSSPFCVNLFSEFVSCHSEKVAAGSKGFVVVDNLGALKPYMTNPCVERMVGALTRLGGDAPGFKCIFVMDRGSTPELYDIVVRHGAKEVAP
jgi:hypothetical protein